MLPTTDLPSLPEGLDILEAVLNSSNRDLSYSSPSRTEDSQQDMTVSALVFQNSMVSIPTNSLTPTNISLLQLSL
jgi:hypothetical protein